MVVTKINRKDKIYVAGHKGMVGSAITRLLQRRGFENLILRSRSELDLRESLSVQMFFQSEKPEFVILSAARVGGIQANINYPAEYLYENLIIQSNVIHQSFLTGVKKLCFLGSSCIYPREAPQPMKEEYLLTGPLEPTNEGYGLAKIAGIKMIEFYRRQYGFCGISLMPCNLYGTNDSFDPLYSHVLSALIRKFVDAVDRNESKVTIWGTGIAKREFMHVDDAAEAVLFMMEVYDSPLHLNIGWGEDVSIKDLAILAAQLTGFQGELHWDTSKPDGMPRKCMDVSRMKVLGYIPQIKLEQGILSMISEYRQLKNLSN